MKARFCFLSGLFSLSAVLSICLNSQQAIKAEATVQLADFKMIQPKSEIKLSLDDFRIQAKVERKFKTGAIKSSKHKLHSTPRHIVSTTTPAQFAIVPKQLSFWLNDQYGDCVTASEAYAKAVWSIQCGLPELFVPDQEVQRWASAGGFLNGATLTDVMDAMIKDGFNVNGTNYKDGQYTSVDFTTESVLQNAISQGPVKLGIDSNALPQSAGNGNGWYATGSGNYGNEDHCVELSAYGTATFCYQSMNLTVPAGVDPNSTGYILFTWNSVGFVSHPWLMSTVQEAWLRNPTTPGQTPSPPTPIPPNPPTPNPPTPNPPIPTPGTPTTITLSAPLAAGTWQVVAADAKVITADTTMSELGSILVGFAGQKTRSAPAVKVQVQQPAPYVGPPPVPPGSDCYYDQNGNQICLPPPPPARVYYQERKAILPWRR